MKPVVRRSYATTGDAEDYQNSVKIDLFESVTGMIDMRYGRRGKYSSHNPQKIAENIRNLSQYGEIKLRTKIKPDTKKRVIDLLDELEISYEILS